MEYTIKKLAALAGVSTRTLRYYDECGLLAPKRVSSNGYRIYGQAELDRLQQILFYRELGVELAEIGRVLSDRHFDAQTALQDHLQALIAKRRQIDIVIGNVEKSLRATKGEITMTNEEKFEGLKQSMIDENERIYGGEIRAKYGGDTINRSNTKLKGMTQEQFAEQEQLTQELNDALREAFEQGDPAGEPAQKACELHKRWLCFYWDSYSKQAHIGVSRLYVDDPRFTAYYDKIAPGCAAFLHEAVKVFCAE